MPGRPAIKIVAVEKEDTSAKLEAGAIWENDNGKLSLQPSKKTDRAAKFPSIRMALLDEKGKDVTGDFWLNVYDNREFEEDSLD